MTTPFKLPGLLLLGLGATACTAEPGPGDIFKEFAWKRTGGQLVFGPGAIAPNAPKNPRPARVPIDIDLEGATRAEVIVEHWSGHEGTSGKSIRCNEGAWIELPLPQNTPTRPECYFAMINQPAVEVPLRDLQHGANILTFTCGPQIHHNFDYPAFSVQGVTLRVYYSAARPHAEARIASPRSGGAIGDDPVFEVEVTAPAGGEAKRVDFVAEYVGFPWGGDGVFRRWHYDYNRMKLEHHVGSATAAPWRVTWDTKWIADQRQPMRLIARVTDASGVVSMTPVVDGLTFKRDRSVVFYPASGVRQFFNSHRGRRSACTINWVERPAKASAARLVLATHGPHEQAAEFGLNGRKLASVTEQPKGQGSKVYHEVDVPLALLKPGDNEFYLFSETQGHAIEGSWPGPALLLEFKP